jgi:dTDP-4-amino-4,6-dideoxygalactose transaminase
MVNGFKVVKDFEEAVAEYTGAPYCVAVNSCTSAIFLCLQYMKSVMGWGVLEAVDLSVKCPKYTYVSVPMQIRLAGFKLEFTDEDWQGQYRLSPFPIYDSARRFTSDMYLPKHFHCTSHHWNKILGIEQGGCILHDDPKADVWLRRARFDGRSEGVPPKCDNFKAIGWHLYLSPSVAANGLVRLGHLPLKNDDLPRSDYPDLSQRPIFWPTD